MVAKPRVHQALEKIMICIRRLFFWRFRRLVVAKKSSGPGRPVSMRFHGRVNGILSRIIPRCQVRRAR